MVQFRRLASFLLGAWLAGSVLMNVGAVENFRSIDRFLAAPVAPAAEQLHSFGGENTRLFLRHIMGEQNRWYSEQWERVQIGLTLSLLLVLLFGERPNKITIVLAACLLMMVLVQRLALTQPITILGRLLDYAPPGTDSVDRREFEAYRAVYKGVELFKFATGLGIAALLLFRKTPDPRHFAREASLTGAPKRRPTR